MLGIALPLFLLSPTKVNASCDLDEVIGYTLIAAKYVRGYIENGEMKYDFEGCSFGRVIVFDDNTGARCTSYSYTYAYHPKAYIFLLGQSIKVCIGEDRMYTLAPIN
jgi:hypothetical protein